MLAAPLVLGPAVAAGSAVIGLAGLALIWLRTGTGTGWDGVLFVILAVWASDSVAYLAGRALGGAKAGAAHLAGQDLVGLAGGPAGAMLVGAMLAVLLPAPAGARRPTASIAAWPPGCCWGWPRRPATSPRAPSSGAAA